MTAALTWQGMWVAMVVATLGGAGMGMVAEAMPRHDWRAMGWGALALALAIAGVGVTR